MIFFQCSSTFVSIIWRIVCLRCEVVEQLVRDLGMTRSGFNVDNVMNVRHCFDVFENLLIHTENLKLCLQVFANWMPKVDVFALFLTSCLFCS